MLATTQSKLTQLRLGLEQLEKSQAMCCGTALPIGGKADALTELSVLKRVAFDLLQRERMKTFGMLATTFFFDFDNVLFDWRKAILKELSQFKTIDQLNKHPKKDELVAEVYKNNPNFFADLEIIPEGAQLLRRSLNRGVNVAFLTALGGLMDNTQIMAQKVKALTRLVEEYQLPAYLIHAIQFVEHSVDKAKYANHYSILFDDFKRNIDDWEKKGGFGVWIDTECMDVEEAFTEANYLLNILSDNR